MRARAPLLLAGAAAAVLLAVVTGVRASAPTPADGAPEAAPSAVAPGADVSESGVFRAFDADSWWNTPVPVEAPTHEDAESILDYLATARQSGDGCITLAGAENSWGQPVYWSSASDPEYDVDVPRVDEPPELAALRIPDGARAAETSDRAMTIFDLDRGYVVALTDARYDEEAGSWRAGGATVTYLDSNGLHARTDRSDDDRNQGTHRGNNGATMMVRYDEVEAGAIDHVLKIASGPELADRAVFPMIGSDGDAAPGSAPPQGLRLRLKPDVDLESHDLHPEALVIAEAFQAYGVYLGDSAGRTALKLENTEAEGRGQLWDVGAQALCSLPLDPDMWDVLPEGYDPSE